MRPPSRYERFAQAQSEPVLERAFIAALPFRAGIPVRREALRKRAQTDLARARARAESPQPAAPQLTGIVVALGMAMGCTAGLGVVLLTGLLQEEHVIHLSPRGESAMLAVGFAGLCLGPVVMFVLLRRLGWLYAGRLARARARAEVEEARRRLALFEETRLPDSSANLRRPDVRETGSAGR